MNFYVALFPESEVLNIKYYEDNDVNNKGKVQQASFILGGREFLCIDTPVKHDFGFTPAISLFIDCESEQEVERLYAALAEGGEVFMPLDGYGFSQRFAWLSDCFGVSWQLNLP